MAFRSIAFAVCVGLCTASAALVPRAAAFDLFGWFRGESTPVPTPAALPYTVTVTVEPAETGLATLIRDTSDLVRLAREAPPDGDSLARRAARDVPAVIDALWGAGHYAATVTIDVAGVPVGLGTDDTASAARAAERSRNQALVPVTILVQPGPLYTWRTVRVLDADTGTSLIDGRVPDRLVTARTGGPARTADLLAMSARIVDHFREEGRALARVERIEPVVLHPQRAVDVTVVVRPGPITPIGQISVSGTQTVDPEVVRTFIYARPGDDYSPERMASIRRSVAQVEALSGVRVREGTALDAAGRLPVSVEVTERLPRVVGGALRYSTVDGPAARLYWGHRNLFGGAESLRLDASVSYLTEGGPGARRAGSDWDDIGGRFSVAFLKPGLFGTPNDFVADGVIVRERTRGYLAEFGTVTLGVRHRIDERTHVQAGLEIERSRSEDVLGVVDATLVGLPLTAVHDTTDNLLDPTRGFRLSLGVTPFLSALGSSVDMTIARASAAAYWPLGPDARTVIAGRVGVGAIWGAELADIPASRRFFAGGGGSVRGFAYRSLSPTFGGDPIGGLSLVEASLEARIRLNETIGIVPFVDAGTAFRSSGFGDFDEIRVAAGLGLRYYTGIGPIRLDVAVPLERRPGDDSFAIYIGFGQAF